MTVPASTPASMAGVPAAPAPAVARFLALCRFEWRRLLRNHPPMFFALAFPILMLGTFGAIFGNDPVSEFGGQGTVDASVPAYIALVIAVTGLMSFPLGVAEYRDRQVLRRLRATPAGSPPILAAQAVVNAVVTVAGVVVLVAFGAAVFGLSAPRRPAHLVLAVLVSVLAVYGVGLVIASVARTERGATVIANLLYFPMIFITGATVPRELLPDWLRTVGDVLPVGLSVQALKWAWQGTGGAYWSSLGWLALIVAGSVAAAVSLFRWD